jgi:hypothetical protein
MIRIPSGARLRTIVLGRRLTIRTRPKDCPTPAPEQSRLEQERTDESGNMKIVAD